MGSPETLSPALGLVLAAALVMALLYAVAAARPLRFLPLYWGWGIAGFAVGQLAAAHGLLVLPVGTLALGTGVVACIVLFVILHLLALWYTWACRAQARARSGPTRRQRLRRS